MELEQKAGQLLIVGFQGSEVTTDSPIIRDIRKRNLGGVILFDRFLAQRKPDNNIISPSQTKELIRRLREQAATPLLVAVDQEGGRVNRFKAERGFAQTASAADLGREPTTAGTTAAAEQTAALLAGLGFNLNLAPVVDLDLCPDNPIIGRYQRSFAADPEKVAEHAAAWVDAHRRQGILTCLKHFPGHGSAREDSHLGFVDVSDSWQPTELIPYRRLLVSDRVDAVMTGHLYNRNLDPHHPATLSAATIAGLLRHELGYTGVVLSDDLQMRAITSRYGFEEAVCGAVRAGVDLLVFGNNLDYDPEITTQAVGAISLGLRNGTISEEAFTAACRRVENLKRALQSGK